MQNTLQTIESESELALVRGGEFKISPKRAAALRYCNKIAGNQADVAGITRYRSCMFDHGELE